MGHLCRRHSYVFTKDRSRTPQTFAFIRNALAVYHLSINETKVQAYESPFQYGKASSPSSYLKGLSPN